MIYMSKNFYELFVLFNSYLYYTTFFLVVTLTICHQNDILSFGKNAENGKIAFTHRLAERKIAFTTKTERM